MCPWLNTEYLVACLWLRLVTGAVCPGVQRGATAGDE